MFHVYVLKSSKNGNLYKGQTSDLQARLLQHNSGKVKSTKSQAGFWKVIYTEQYETREEALKREKYFKTAAGRRFIKNAIE